MSQPVRSITLHWGFSIPAKSVFLWAVAGNFSSANPQIVSLCNSFANQVGEYFKARYGVQVVRNKMPYVGEFVESRVDFMVDGDSLELVLMSRSITKNTAAKDLQCQFAMLVDGLAKWRRKEQTDLPPGIKL